MSSAIISGDGQKKRAFVVTKFGQLKGKHQWHVPEEEEDKAGKERPVSF